MDEKNQRLILPKITEEQRQLRKDYDTLLEKVTMFNDMTCPYCRKRMGWVGPIPDKITCTRCDRVIDMTATKREIDEAREALFAEKKKRKEKYKDEVPDQDH